MNELVKIPHGDLRRSSLELPPGLPETEWKAVGHRLCSCKGSLNFWLGDWLNYGNAAYGEKYSTAMEIFKAEGHEEYGLEGKTLRNIASIARRIPMSLRRDNLSWSHHVLVADNFDTDKDKEKWIVKASVNEWTVAELSREIRKKQKLKGVAGTSLLAGVWTWENWFTKENIVLQKHLKDLGEWEDSTLRERIRKFSDLQKPLIEEARRREMEVAA